MVDFPGALPPIGGPSGAPTLDQAARARQDAADLATGFDHLHDRLKIVAEDPSQVDDGHFIGQFLDDLTYTQSALDKIDLDYKDGKISKAALEEIAGDGKSGGMIAGFYEICDTPISGVRLREMMHHLDPPPMTDAAHYCQGLANGSRTWLEESVLPDLKNMSEALQNYRG